MDNPLVVASLSEPVVAAKPKKTDSPVVSAAAHMDETKSRIPKPLDVQDTLPMDISSHEIWPIGTRSLHAIKLISPYRPCFPQENFSRGKCLYPYSFFIG